MDIIKAIEQEQINENVANFKVGDQVKVHVKIKEGNRERIQIFEGFVLKKQNGGVSETFTVRRISFGVGVERTFPLHSPKIADIKVEILKFLQRGFCCLCHGICRIAQNNPFRLGDADMMMHGIIIKNILFQCQTIFF